MNNNFTDFRSAKINSVNLAGGGENKKIIGKVLSRDVAIKKFNELLEKTQSKEGVTCSDRTHMDKFDKFDKFDKMELGERVKSYNKFK